MYDAIIFTDVSDNHTSQIAIGAFKLANSLRQKGYKCLVINHLSYFTVDELKAILDKSLSDKTKFIGFSTTFFRKVVSVSGYYNYEPMGIETFFPQGKEFEDSIISYCKQLNPTIKIVVGGTKTTFNYTNKNADYVFIGYSEISIINLMNHLDNGEPLLNTKKNIYGIYIVDDRTAPTYDFVNDRMVWEKTDIVNHKLLPIELGRGCIFKCNFCSYPLNGKKNLNYVKSAEVLRAELLRNYELYDISSYIIVDDTFNDYTEKLILIESVVKSLPFQPKFWCYSRLDLIATRPETIHTLYNLGVRSFYFGIESLHHFASRAVGKGFDKEKQIETIAKLKTTYPDVSLHGSFIIGLPEESEDHILNTVDRIKSRDILLDSWVFHGLKIYKKGIQTFNSEFDLNYEKYGYEIAVESEHPYIIWKNKHFTYDSATTLAEMIMQESRKLDAFKVPGHDSFQLTNYNYNFEELIKTPFNKFNFHNLGIVDTPNFITSYKQKLLELLS
jgi:hypothetical protein